MKKIILIVDDAPANIQLLSGVLKETYKVKGTVDNFHIYPLAPSAVGYKLQKMMKNTVQRPIKLIQKSAD